MSYRKTRKTEGGPGAEVDDDFVPERQRRRASAPLPAAAPMLASVATTTTAAAAAPAVVLSAAAPTPRARGRPRKQPLPPGSAPPAVTSRPRGRPPAAATQAQQRQYATVDEVEEMAGALAAVAAVAAEAVSTRVPQQPAASQLPSPSVQQIEQQQAATTANGDADEDGDYEDDEDDDTGRRKRKKQRQRKSQEDKAQQRPAAAAAAKPAGGRRNDVSLLTLTRQFVQLVRRTQGHTAELNAAAQTLGTQKRRIYDITNVLEGIGMLEKTTKNNIRWRIDPAVELPPSPPPAQELPLPLAGEPVAPDSAVVPPSLSTAKASEQAAEESALKAEIARLTHEEQGVDTQLLQVSAQVRRLVDDPEFARHAFLSYEELLSLPRLAGRTVLAVRAPSGTVMEVPDPDEGLVPPERRFHIYMHSTTGPIAIMPVCVGGELSVDATPPVPATAAAAVLPPPLPSLPSLLPAVAAPEPPTTAVPSAIPLPDIPPQLPVPDLPMDGILSDPLLDVGMSMGFPTRAFEEDFDSLASWWDSHQ